MVTGERCLLRMKRAIKILLFSVLSNDYQADDVEIIKSDQSNNGFKFTEIGAHLAANFFIALFFTNAR